MDMRKIVGANVRNARIAAKLTQEELAERSGFSQQYVSGLERGRRNPTIVTLYEFAQALNVSHVELVDPSLPSRSGGDGPTMSAPKAKSS